MAPSLKVFPSDNGNHTDSTAQSQSNYLKFEELARARNKPERMRLAWAAAVEYLTNNASPNNPGIAISNCARLLLVHTAPNLTSNKCFALSFEASAYLSAQQHVAKLWGDS